MADYYPEGKSWVTDAGEFGSNAILLFDYQNLTEWQWDNVDHMHDSVRLKYIKCILDADEEGATQIEEDEGIMKP